MRMVGKYKNLKKIFQQSRQAVLHDANTQSIVNGLKNNEFKIYLQFIVDNKTKKICRYYTFKNHNSITQRINFTYIYN